MKTIDVRTLLNGTNKQINIPDEIMFAYRNWREKRAGDVKPEEIFYAGYILSNPIVRGLFKKDKQDRI